MRRAPLIVALVAGLALTGCGIPDNTEVKPLRPGPSTGVSAGDDSAPARTLRTDTQDPGEFVQNYLAAAAGDFEGATERVKQFLSPSAAATFKASADIKVVRLTEPPLVEPGSAEVTINVQQIGTLDAKGILEPGTGESVAYKLTVRELEGQQGLFVTGAAPQALLLSDDALDRFYTRRTIYFWNSDRTGLVPDVRYMPRSVPVEQQPTEIIDWLLSGPSRWLTGAVAELPEGTKAIGNVPAVSNDTLQISLSGPVVAPDDPEALDRLQEQLRWSLRDNLPGTLELTVEQQFEKRRYTGTEYLASNPAYRQIAEAERFVVYNGQIRRLLRSYNSGRPVPLIAPEANRDVRMAALSTSGSRWWTALVVNESGGRQALRVGAAGPGEYATLRRIALPAPIGRPVWAKSPVGADTGTTGLVTAGGSLYTFTPEGSSAVKVQWPGGPRNITAVAVAPDAHRVAVLAGGNLFIATLTSNEEEGPEMSPARVIRTRLTGLTAVDWSSESLLAVAGKRSDSSRVAIMDVSIDGAQQTDRLSDLGSNPVTYLAALPANPTRGEETGTIAYVLDGAAYDEINPDPIGVDDLAEQVADPPPNVQPSAPFFLS
jgi:hypothetical protein